MQPFIIYNFNNQNLVYIKVMESIFSDCNGYVKYIKMETERMKHKAGSAEWKKIIYKSLVASQYNLRYPNELFWNYISTVRV